MITVGRALTIAVCMLVPFALGGCMGKEQNVVSGCCHLSVAPQPNWTGPAWSLEEVPEPYRSPELANLLAASAASGDLERLEVTQDRCNEVGGNLTRMWFEEGYREWKGPMVKHHRLVYLVSCESWVS